VQHNSFFISTAIIPNAPPKASEPVSPINTCAGYELNQRNPKPAPISAAIKTVNSPAPGK